MSGRNAGFLFVIPCLLAATSAYAQSAPPPPADEKPAGDQAPPAAGATDANGGPPSTPVAKEHTLESAPPVSQPTNDLGFNREPFTISTGEGKQKWKLQIYGFTEFDAIHDSTQTYGDYAGNASISADSTYAGQHGRLQFTPRNSRIGLKMASPEFAGLKPSAVLEGDFFGVDNGSFTKAGGSLTTPQGAVGTNAPSGGGNEQKLFNSPTFRIRHAYLKLENDVADVLIGQYYYLFGQQPMFFPMSVEFLGLPNMIFGRTAQVRLAKTIKSDAVNVDIAIAAMRPPQRESETPEGQAALKLSINGWKGIHTPGNGGTTADPMQIGVSGLVREFRVNQWSSNPQGYNEDFGWGLSVDALVPIVPVKNADDRSNALTLTGSYVNGSGMGDMYTGSIGGEAFRAPTTTVMGMTTQQVYNPNVDPYMVTYDKYGYLHTIDWQSFMVGLQWYLPPAGHIILSGNVTEAWSNNLKDVWGTANNVFRLARYIDGNAFFDVAPAVRLGVSYQNMYQTFTDESHATNHRLMALGLYFF